MKKVIKFVQDGCVPCVVLGNMLNDMEKVVHEEIYITEENHEEVKEKYSIMGTPTLIAFDGDEEIARVTGVNAGQIMNFYEEVEIG